MLTRGSDGERRQRVSIRLFTVLCVVVALAVPRATLAQNSATDRSADAAAIRAHIESIFQGFVEKDRKKLEETHGANWRGFTPWSGRVIRGRADYMNSATFPEGLPKGQGMIGYRISDFDVPRLMLKRCTSPASRR